METLQAIYNSEINAMIYWNWDGGVEVRLGNGFYGTEENWEASGNVPTMEAAEEWLIAKAIELYPRSKFTKDYMTKINKYKLPGSDGISSKLEALGK